MRWDVLAKLDACCFHWALWNDRWSLDLVVIDLVRVEGLLPRHLFAHLSTLAVVVAPLVDAIDDGVVLVWVLVHALGLAIHSLQPQLLSLADLGFLLLPCDVVGFKARQFLSLHLAAVDTKSLDHLLKSEVHGTLNVSHLLVRQVDVQVLHAAAVASMGSSVLRETHLLGGLARQLLTLPVLMHLRMKRHWVLSKWVLALESALSRAHDLVHVGQVLV